MAPAVVLIYDAFVQDRKLSVMRTCLSSGRATRCLSARVSRNVNARSHLIYLQLMENERYKNGKCTKICGGPLGGKGAAFGDGAPYDEHMVQASLFCSEHASLAAASCMAAISSSSADCVLFTPGLEGSFFCTLLVLSCSTSADWSTVN